MTMTTSKMHAVYEPLGWRVRELRRRSGKTQAAIAAAVGLSRTSIANIEAGRQGFPFHTFFDLASALGVEAAELLPEIPQDGDGMSALEGVIGELSESQREAVQRVIRKQPRKRG